MLELPTTGDGPGTRPADEPAGPTAERTSVDWSTPIVDAAIERLLAGDLEAGPGDLRGVVVVLAGGRAGRLLLRDLGIRAAADGVALVPPRVTTPAILPALVAEAADASPPATPQESLLAAVAAIEAADPADRAALLGEVADDPAAAPLSAVLHAAAVRLVGLEHELAAGGRRPDDAAAHLRAEQRPEECQAWEAVARVAELRRRHLEEAGLRDPALPVEPDTLSRVDASRLPAAIMLVGLAELAVPVRSALAAAAAAGVRLLTVVRGRPPAGGEGFDGLGCVVPAAWTGIDVLEDESQLLVAESLGDQAALAVQAAAELTADGAADDAVLGVLDPALRRPLAVAAAAAGGSIHLAGGRRLGDRAAWRLLERLARWRADRRADTLADLVRIPRFERLLGGRADVAAGGAADGEPGRRGGRRDAPALLDELIRERLPDRLDAAELPAQATEPRARARLAVTRRAMAEADRILEPLEGPARALSAWSGPLALVLAGANRDRTRPGGEEDDAEDWVRLARVADGLAAIPPSLDRTLDGFAALELLLHLAADEALPERPEPEAIDAVGLLELPFDPAPGLVVAGVHDESVPGRGRRDPLLPEALRRGLGLPADGDRLGRDAYLVAAAVRGRTRVRVIAGRRGAAGDPLIPSRILLPSDPGRLAARLARMVDADRVAQPRPLPAPGGDGEGFPVPALRGLPVPERIRVTAFRDHLACPYRFALAHVLRLDVVEDDPRELDPAGFGTVLHAALQGFGQDPACRALADEDRIAAALEEHLDRAGRERFGRRARPAVRLQVDRMRQRLQHFARLQASWRQEGWRIVKAEHALEDAAIRLEDGFAMPVTGIVDRIDRNERTGRWRIIDYKTGDTARTPHEAHHGSKRPPGPDARWIDLQLPLYAHLLEGRPVGDPPQVVEGPVEVGYVLLPRSAARVRWEAAEWDAGHREAALAEARRIVEEVRTGDYEPADRVPRFDRYAWIVQRPALLLGDGAAAGPDDVDGEHQGGDGAVAAAREVTR